LENFFNFGKKNYNVGAHRDVLKLKWGQSRGEAEPRWGDVQRSKLQVQGSMFWNIGSEPKKRCSMSNVYFKKGSERQYFAGGIEMHPIKSHIWDYYLYGVRANNIKIYW